MSPVGAIFVPFPPKTGTKLLHPHAPQSLNGSGGCPEDLNAFRFFFEIHTHAYILTLNKIKRSFGVLLQSAWTQVDKNFPPVSRGTKSVAHDITFRTLKSCSNKTQDFDDIRRDAMNWLKNIG